MWDYDWGYVEIDRGMGKVKMTGVDRVPWKLGFLERNGNGGGEW